MRCLRVHTVMFAGSPDFVKQKRIGDISAPVQIVRQATVFTARRPDQGAEFSLEQRVLPLSWTQHHHQRDRIFGQLCLSS